VDPGSIVGLFGESGCGKTTLALALLNLPPSPALPRSRLRPTEGLRDAFPRPNASSNGIRGAEISLVFQDPLLALNPVLRVRDQVAEVMRAPWTPG